MESGLLGLTPHITSFAGPITNSASYPSNYHFGFLETLIYQTGGKINNLILPATTGYLGKNNLICFFKLKKKLK
jgi:hypothetical protein